MVIKYTCDICRAVCFLRLCLIKKLIWNICISDCNDSVWYHLVSIWHSAKTYDDAERQIEERSDVQEYDRLLEEDLQAGGRKCLLQGCLLQHPAWYGSRTCARLLRWSESLHLLISGTFNFSLVRQSTEQHSVDNSKF